MTTYTAQRSIPLTIMRGGTSKALFFREEALPPPGDERDAVLLRLMGSPDVLQIDGLGGSRPITSKVAVVGPSSHAEADIDYTFAQVDVEGSHVVYTANCGNISSAVGPFAIDERIVAHVEGANRVRIHNTNTGAIMVAHVEVRNGFAAVEGDVSIPGVPGTASEILMNWAGAVGAHFGDLFPTGEPLNTITLDDGRRIDLTISDAGNPVAWVRASDIGCRGDELPHEVDDNPDLLELLREIRGRAAHLIGWCDDWSSADSISPGIPLVGWVAPSTDYTTIRGHHVATSDSDLLVRVHFMNRLHESLPGTSSVTLTATAVTPGTVPAELTRVQSAEGTLRAGHPQGVMPITYARSAAADRSFELLGISRTARRIADCVAYVPQGIGR